MPRPVLCLPGGHLGFGEEHPAACQSRAGAGGGRCLRSSAFCGKQNQQAAAQLRTALFPPQMTPKRRSVTKNYIH